MLLKVLETNYGKIQYSDMDGSMFITTIGVGSGYDLNIGTKENVRLNISGNGGMRTYSSPEFYGRSWGIYIFTWQTLIAIGGVALGFLADQLTPRGAIAFGAIMALGMSIYLRVRFRAPE